MAWLVTIGGELGGEFPAYDAGGADRVPGLNAASFSLEVTLNEVGQVVALLDDPGGDPPAGQAFLSEIAEHPGKYRLRMIGSAVGRYRITIRRIVQPGQIDDFLEEFDVKPVGSDPALADVLIEWSGISNLGVDNPFVPVMRFRRRSTRALFDVDVQQVRILQANAQTLIEAIAAGDITRTALGTYTFEPALIENPGSIWVEVTFRLPEAPAVDLLDIVRLLILSAEEQAEFAGAAGGLRRVYTAPSFLEDMGFDLAALTPRQRWVLIQNTASIIDTLTGQWFNPEEMTLYLSGKDSVLVQHSTRPKAAAISAVEVLSTRTRTHLVLDYAPLIGVVDLTYIINHGRFLEAIGNRFPDGALNIKVDGVFGVFDNYKEVETTTTEEIVQGSTSVAVQATTGFSARDVVEFLPEGEDGVRVILTAVSHANGQLFFDQLGSLISSLPVGTTVRTFGQTPPAIEALSGFLFSTALMEFRANQVGEPAVDPSRIRSERTDDYEYELFDTAEARALITGSARFDEVLRSYSLPGTVIVI